jgi:hypothetical protein
MTSIIDTDLECINEYEDHCRGSVEYRMALSDTGQSFPRCEAHWAEAVDREMDLRRRYPVIAPADWDPSYAGERWDDDY